MVQLSRHFSLAELTTSDAAGDLKLRNTPLAAHLANLRTLALGLEQVRSVLGDRAITVESAYRSAKVNAAVGGVANSAHALGLAADFTVAGLTALAAARQLAASWLVFDQLILEVSRGVCHISFAPTLRGEVLTQRGGPGTATVVGLPKVPKA